MATHSSILALEISWTEEGLCFCMWAFSSCGTQASCGGFSCCGAQALEHGLSSCGTWAYLPRSMRDFPKPGIKPEPPILAGRFLSTGLQG